MLQPLIMEEIHTYNIVSIEYRIIVCFISVVLVLDVVKHIQRIQTVYRYLPKLPGGDILPTTTDALYSNAVHPICVPIRAIHK